MASIASSSAAPALAFYQHTSEEDRIKILQIMTSLIIDQEPGLEKEELIQKLAERVQHDNPLCTLADIKLFISNAKRAASQVSAIDERERHILERKQQIEDEIEQKGGTRQHKAAMRQKNKDIFTAAAAIKPHNHSVLITAQLTFVNALSHYVNRSISLKRTRQTEEKEAQERVRQQVREEKRKRKEEEKMEKEERKKKAKEDREAAMEAEKENLKTTNIDTAASLRKYDQQQFLKDKQLHREVLHQFAKRVLNRLDSQLSNIPYEEAEAYLLDGEEEEEGKEERKVFFPH